MLTVWMWKLFSFFLFLPSCIGKKSWEWVGGISGLALGRRWIHLPHVLPEAGINLKGGGAPFLALLIKHNVLLLTPGGAVTQERGMGALNHDSQWIHGAEVAPWIPQAVFQDWRETYWHSWMLSTWLAEIRRVLFVLFVHHWPSHLHSHIRNKILKIFDCRQADELILLERFHLLLKILCKAKYVAVCQQYHCE